VTTDEQVKAVAKVIREQIDVLLADYESDASIILDQDQGDQPTVTRLQACAKMYGIELLRETWTAEAASVEERLEGVAKAAIDAMRGGTS